MKIAGIDFPIEIWDALHKGNLVVFAGAGVSKASGLPDFKELAEQIAYGSGENRKDGEPIDEFLDRLKRSGMDVHNIAAQKLTSQGLKTELQKNLLRLFSDARSVRIVTTNYDQLFEKASEEVFDEKTSVYQYPALPLGSNFNGIVHLHGAVDQPNEMILTSGDLGKAYIHEERVGKFVLDLFENFTVLFVGYSHNDIMMNYLIKPLSDSNKPIKPLFSLMPECHKGEWEHTEIKPIYFPATEQDYSHLDQAIKEVVKRLSVDIIGWRKNIKEIAKEKPSTISDEKIEIIVEKLEDVTILRSFTDSARDPEWIGWLDDKGYLDALFVGESIKEQGEEIDEKRDILSYWLARYFIREHSEYLFRLIGEPDMKKLHPVFWCWLGLNISSKDQESLDKDLLSRWVLLLLETAPGTVSQYGHVLLSLGESCSKHKLWSDLLRIFNSLSRSRLNVSEDLIWKHIHDVPEHDAIKMEGEVLLTGNYSDHMNRDEFWKKYLRPNLDKVAGKIKVAEKILEDYVPRWEDMFYTLCAWKERTDRFDSMSSHRSAIEHHKQNRHPKSVDVLIDAMRDCLEWLIENETQSAERWCVRLVGSDSPLLHRLAVHGISERKDLSADEKIDWLLKNVNFHKFYIHHEIFRAIQLAYPKASQDRRKKVIAEVKQYLSPIREEWHKWQKIFDWFDWLNHADHDCSLLKQELDNIREKYPEIEASPHRDFTYSSEVQIQMRAPESPRSVEELLSKHAAEQLDYLLNYEDERFRYPFSRNGLLQTVTAASKKDFGWGIGLAKTLSEAEKSSDLWSSLMDAWSDMDLDYTSDLLPQAEKAASILWRNLKQGEELQSGNWMTKAINHTAGKIALFWCKVIILWRSKQESAPNELPENYRKELSNIVHDKTVHGRLGRTILAWHLSFFLDVDAAWTKKNLVPLFDANNLDEDCRAVWDGFLVGGRITPMVAEELEEYFLKMTDHIVDIFTDEISKIKENFIECYVGMINYSVSDPFPEWIPKIFQHEDDSIRYIFADQIWTMLMDLEGEKQKRCWDKWLKTYWENRLLGKPKPLNSKEINHMIEWLPYLTEVFPEAVALAVAMPLKTASLESRVLYELNESDSKLWDRYPEDVARLLVHLGESKSSGHGWYKLPKLVDKLFKKGISPRHTRGLEELLAKLGFDFSD